MLTLAEETTIKEAGQLKDQVTVLTTVITSKESQGSDALQGFIMSSNAPVSQLILNYGN